MSDIRQEQDFEILKNNIKKIRERLQLSVAKFAADLEIPPITITSYERGERKPSALFFILLYKKGINLNWLISGKGDMFIKNDKQTEKNDLLKDEIKKEIVDELKEWIKTEFPRST